MFSLKKSRLLLSRQTKRGIMHVRACALGELGTEGHLANADDTTGPGQSPAQDVFSNVWRDRQSAGLMHWSTR